MSYRDILKDNRYVLAAPSNSALVGQYIRILKSGANRVVGEPTGTPHPYSAVYVTKYDGAYKWRSVANPNIWGWSGYVGPSVQEKWTANDDLALINKLRVRLHESEWNGPTAAVELGKTVDMLADRTRQIAKACSQAKRGNFAAAAATMRSDPRSLNQKGRRNAAEKQSLTNAQLELQYGFRAAASDVYNLSGAIDDRVTRGKRVFASIKVGNGVTPHPSYPVACESYRRKSIVAYLTLDEPTWQERFGLTEPASAAWELLPWSFVIDWMMPVGDFISAQQFAMNTKGLFVFTDKSTTRFSGGSVLNDNPQYVLEDVGRYFSEATTFSRTIGHSIYVPLPKIKSNLLGGEPLNRLANAFSLLVGLGSGRKQGQHGF